MDGCDLLGATIAEPRGYQRVALRDAEALGEVVGDLLALLDHLADRRSQSGNFAEVLGAASVRSRDNHCRVEPELFSGVLPLLRQGSAVLDGFLAGPRH